MPPIDPETRHHGYLTFKLLNRYPDWVRRRVDHVALRDDAIARRSTSVDFRIETWFGPAFQDATARTPEQFYLPLSLRSKEALLDFDLRDETGRALPLLSSSRSAALAAATLCTLAEDIVIAATQAARVESSSAGFGLPPETGQMTRRLIIPDDLQATFLRYCGNELDIGSREEAIAEVGRFIEGIPSKPRAVADWRWTEQSDGTYAADVDEATWRAAIATPDFQTYLLDFTRLYLLATPVPAAIGTRHVFKLGGDELRARQAISLFKKRSDRRRATVRVARGFLPIQTATALADRLEGLPQGVEDEWLVVRNDQRRREPLHVLSWLSQRLGWSDHLLELKANDVGKSQSYHVEFEAPAGTQIRRAQLSLQPQGKDKIQRGARNFTRVHLHARGPESAQGALTIHLRLRPGNMVPGLLLAALLACVTLIAGYRFLDRLTAEPTTSIGPFITTALLTPGLLAGIVSRSDEHPQTTSMLVGVRAMAVLVGGAPIMAAVSLAGDPHGQWLKAFWLGMVFVETVVLLVLLVGAVLSARPRPRLKKAKNLADESGRL